MSVLRVLSAGPLCTLQDAGRTGWLRYGVTPAGPMDWISHATANLFAGNPAGAGAIEIGPAGIKLQAEGGSLRIGLAARGFSVRLGIHVLPTRMALTLREKEVLTIAPGHEGQWAYLSLAGGFDLAPVMGSHATHTRSAIGPCGGAALKAGQVLGARQNAPADAPDMAWIAPPAPWSGIIRYVPGPQAGHFSDQTHADFAAATWSVSARSDRMGYRLDGPVLSHAKGHDIVSDGIALGAIQVPGDGRPIVLMADRQPTGGYPKIGCVIRADLPILAQRRSGQGVQFKPVSIDGAVAALRAAVPTEIGMRPQMRRIVFGGR
jgi:biotin-dependent carboxylase-like uncharacterized protein